MTWRRSKRRHQLQVVFNICYGHSCFLLSRERIRRVRNAVIINPSLSVVRGDYRSDVGCELSRSCRRDCQFSFNSVLVSLNIITFFLNLTDIGRLSRCLFDER